MTGSSSVGSDDLTGIMFVQAYVCIIYYDNVWVESLENDTRKRDITEKRR